MRRFITAAARELAIELTWQGSGIGEMGVVAGPGAAPAPGQVIVRVDPKYFRPTEVETLLGDPTKVREKLGWVPKTTLQELVPEMALADLREAERDELCRREGYRVLSFHELGEGGGKAWFAGRKTRHSAIALPFAWDPITGAHFAKAANDDVRMYLTALAKQCTLIYSIRWHQ